MLTAIKQPDFDHSDSIYNSSGSTFYRNGNSRSVNGSSLARSNSSKWEKPPFKKIVRRAASVPPGLSQISERGTEEDGAFHQRSRSSRTKRSINSEMTVSGNQQAEQQSYSRTSHEVMRSRVFEVNSNLCRIITMIDRAQTERAVQ